MLRAQSSNSILRASAITSDGKPKTRARSASLVTVTEVGGDEPENVVDRMGTGSNENAAWVNAPGAWAIHPVLILLAKILIDAIPGMTQDVSWTIVNLGYMAVSLRLLPLAHCSPPFSCSTTLQAFRLNPRKL
jgi:hypothetical protein